MENFEEHIEFGPADDLAWITGSQIGIGITMNKEGELTGERYIVIRLFTPDHYFTVAGSVIGFMKLATDIMEIVGGINDY